MTPKQTGAFIASLRKEQGWTQQALADKLNVTVKAVSRWETGKGYPDVTTLPLLSELFSVSVGELLNGERVPPTQTEMSATTALIEVYSDAAHVRTKNRSLLIGICILAAVAVFLICVCVGLGISRLTYDLKGRSYCILADDLSYMTYYGERYVPLDTGVYECRIGDEIVDEVQLASGDIVSKLFSEYNIHQVIGVPDYELLYLQSEHDISYYVKETCKTDYEQRLFSFEPKTVYAMLEQPDWYEKECSLDSTISKALAALTKEDIDTTRTCEYVPKQWRSTVIAYEESGVFFKEYGDIFKQDGAYYWYDYGNEPYPDSVAHTHAPYRLSGDCYDVLDELFSYVK